jgi:MFS family permease
MVVMFGFAIVFVLSFGVTFLPNLVNDRYGFDDQQRGIAFSFGAVGTLALSVLMARWRQINHVRGIAIGVACVGGMCLAALVLSSPWLLVPAFMLRGGFMMAWSLLTPLASDITPKHLQERAFAGIEFSTGVGNTLAPVLAGIAYEAHRSVPFVIGAGVLPMLALGAIWLGRNVVAPELDRKRRIDRLSSAEPATAT